MKQLKDIEKILGQKTRLKAEYEKRNREAPIEKKIFNIKVLQKGLNDQKKKLLNEINEDNYMLNPTNYVQEKNKLEQKKNRLKISKITKEQKKELLINFVKDILQCLNLKIKSIEEQEEILKLIYQFRYFMCLPFDLENNVKDIKDLEKDIIKTEKNLVKKAIEKRVISKVPFEIMRHLFETRIIMLEELYFKVENINDKCYVQIFDENVTEERFEIKSIGETKKNKKIKIFM